MIRLLDFGDGVNDIRMAADGSMWVACAGMRLFRVMPDLTVREYPVKNGAEKLVRAGEAMWILTSTDGAYRVQNDVFKPYSKSTGDLPSDAVWSVHEDRNGILIGTSAGLVRITPDGKRRVFDAADGLSGLPVMGLFPTSAASDRPASYWVVTPNHLHQLTDDNLLKGNSFATLSKEMSGTHWVHPSDDFKTLYLGTGSGLVMYDLTRSGRDIPAPKVAIQGVTIQSVRFPAWMDGEIRHRASSSTLEFDFAGLTFIKESDTRFSYRLVGLDDEWSAPQSNRTVRYANVPPGSYEFQVRALNIDGVASTEAATLRVDLDPPWWMHPIVAMLLLAGVLATLVAGIRWRVRQIRADIVKRNEQKQFEAIQRIGASISHDIKNTVFSLSLLSKNLEKRFDNPEFRKDAIETIESSLTYLSTLVDRLQQKPSADLRWMDIPLGSLCADVAKRVTAGTDRRVDVDIPASMTIRVQPEPIERILENLIRNAIEATTPAQRVRVSAQQVGPNTELFVMDEGPGMSEDFLRNRLFKPFQSTKTKGLGIGLYSCKELADAMGATIEVESELGKGTTFRLRFVSSSP
jgi:signal transduction histidine kinase